MNIKDKYILLAIIPLLGGIYLKLSHAYTEHFIADKFLPLFICLGLLFYLGRKHFVYWDQHFLKQPYVLRLHSLLSFIYAVLLVFFISQTNLQEWYFGLTMRSAPFYIFPFILSGYIIPFIFFSHVLADTLNMLERYIYIGIAHLIMLVNVLFWLLKG